MSVGPLGGIVGSAAGAPAAQTTGSDVDRARQDASGQQRQVTSAERADNAAGIAETDGQEHETNDRDADGRRLWEIGKGRRAASAGPSAEVPAPSKDASGNRGNELDLTG